MGHSRTGSVGGRALANRIAPPLDHSTTAHEEGPRDACVAEGPRDACVVLVADPELMFAELTASALRTYPGVDVVPQHPRTKAEAVQAVEDHRPDLVLLEYRLEDTTAPAAVRAVRDLAPSTRVVVLSALPPGPHVSDSLRAGADGCLAKGGSFDDLVEAVQRVQRSQPPLSMGAIKNWRRRADRRPLGLPEDAFASLAPRELETLRLLGDGLRVRNIACRLNLSESTVRNYVRSMLHKTHTGSQVEVIALAREHGVIA